MHKIVKKDEGTIRKISDNKISINLITKDFSPNISLAITQADDFQEKEISKNDRIYYILEGKMIINCENVKNELSAGDSIFISKGTEYEMSGTFKAIITNSPAYGIQPNS